jgi:hypothetical protein
MSQGLFLCNDEPEGGAIEEPVKADRQEAILF